MRLVLPRLYVILDAALLEIPVKECAKSLVDAGVRLIQYRNKRASGRELFETSRELATFLTPLGVQVIVNDRADVAALAGAAGVHVGQDDLGVEQARLVMGEGDGWGCPRIMPGNSAARSRLRRITSRWDRFFRRVRRKIPIRWLAWGL